MPITHQLFYLFILAIPVACIAWTVTHEEVFREPREICLKRSQHGRTLGERKFFYLFTCEYCFSHYVTILILIITHFQLAFLGWRGYIISGFSLVWVANIYMNLFQMIRVDMKREKIEAELKETELKEVRGEKVSIIKEI